MTREANQLRAYAVSTAVGSGKTRAAVEYIASKDSARQNFIYVAPTIRLIEQTTAALRKAIGDLGGHRDVALIHSEAQRGTGVPVLTETADIINSAPKDAGSVVIVTTQTFLRVIPKINAPAHWKVIVDEGFTPIEFLPVHLGVRAQSGLEHFLEVFAIDTLRGHRVVPVRGQDKWVAQIAAQGLGRSGARYVAFQSLAASVSNEIMECELLITPHGEAVLAHAESGSDVPPEAKLEIAAYVTSTWLPRFAEVVFMSALFEHTLLYHFWSRVYGVTFEKHPVFERANLRNVHADQGAQVRVGHLLHPDDRSSKHNLGRNFETGEPDEKEPGKRVIDRLVTLCEEQFSGSSFLLQTNNAYGYTPNSPLMPPNAVKVPALSHGLNEFQDHDNVAALAVTNPTPAQGRWIVSKTGLSQEETNMAYRLHTTYQAVGRSSIRQWDPTNHPKTFLTVGESDAKMLHAIFEGSEWLGQVGDMGPLSVAVEEKETKADQIGKQIMAHLNDLALQTTKVTSRHLKGIIGKDCSSATWGRAVEAAMGLEWNWGWEKDGQSLRRLQAADFGFEVEEGYSDQERVPG